jgi:hypothetical protein
MAFRAARFVAKFAAEISNSCTLLFIQVVYAGNLAVFSKADDK